MKHIFVLSAFLLTATGLWAQITPPKKTFYVQKKTKIAVTTYDSVLVDPKMEPGGKKLAFYYEWRSAKNPQLADADRTERLYFELTTAQAKSFTAKGAELTKANTIRCRICFCLDGGCRPDTKGELTVKKVGRNAWSVQFKDDPESEKYLVNETFTLQKAPQTNP